MAIQIPNPGTGNGATGDNEFVLWTKTKDNFSDQTNAASRLVGVSDNQVPMAQQAFKAVHTKATDSYVVNTEGADFNTLKVGERDFMPQGAANGLTGVTGGYVIVNTTVLRSSTKMQQAVSATTPDMRMRAFNGSSWTPWAKFYSTHNTTIDGNGLLKPSSPVLRVFNDRIEGNADGDEMAAEYIKNGVGDYTITGTTGLRTDGWYVVIPNDMNGNPKVAIGTLDDKDGVITLKTYVRIFDMSTFKFVPDLEQPLDIPEGRWIDLRFNDLPIDESEISEV